MFKNETVFILGAGASWHYGYPTGEELVYALEKMAIQLRDHCRARRSSGFIIHEIPQYVLPKIVQSAGVNGARIAWEAVAQECEDFIRRLNAVRPTMIDYFLGWNESLRPIGKLLIAAVILECEAVFHSTKRNRNRPLKEREHAKDNWYRFLVHKLLIGCTKSDDLLLNRVRFITFNYDTSLEAELYQSLSSIDMLNETTIRDFLEADRIIHVYGSVRPKIPVADDFIDERVSQEFGAMIQTNSDLRVSVSPRMKLMDQWFVASQNLLTIDPHDKGMNQSDSAKARNWLNQANIVYILGYGFDTNNNKRLNLADQLRERKGNKKSVMFTNFEDRNTVNKQAARIFYGTYDDFLNKFVHGAPSLGDFREKSTRTVYEALEKDFESLESLLVAGSGLSDSL